MYKENKDIKKFPSIVNLKESEQRNFKKMLKNNLVDEDLNLSSKKIIEKYSDELLLGKVDNDTKDTWFCKYMWVFSELSNEINYSVFMSEVENVVTKELKEENKLKRIISF